MLLTRRCHPLHSVAQLLVAQDYPPSAAEPDSRGRKLANKQLQRSEVAVCWNITVIVDKSNDHRLVSQWRLAFLDPSLPDTYSVFAQ